MRVIRGWKWQDACDKPLTGRNRARERMALGWAIMKASFVSRAWNVLRIGLWERKGL